MRRLTPLLTVGLVGLVATFASHGAREGRRRAGARGGNAPGRPHRQAVFGWAAGAGTALVATRRDADTVKPGKRVAAPGNPETLAGAVTAPDRFIALLYAGAAPPALGVVSLGIGLLTA
jgi:hypothetical protein